VEAAPRVRRQSAILLSRAFQQQLLLLPQAEQAMHCQSHIIMAAQHKVAHFASYTDKTAHVTVAHINVQ
jgi:hypothetical protein